MVRFFDNTPIQSLIATNLNKRLEKILTEGRFIFGSEVSELEEKLSSYLGVKHTICCANGTDSLILGLRASTKKFSKIAKPEVITTAYSYFASCEIIEHCRMKSVFVDIEPDTFNLDPTKIENAINENTVAILPVSLFGQCPNLAEINKIAEKYNLPVIEDAAQSFGARIGDKYSGSLTTVACTSFFPTKPLGCYGDGGACFTNDDEIAATIRHLANHGTTNKPHHHSDIGFNSRLDTIQAAVLLEKLAIIDHIINLRINAAKLYDEHLNNVGDIQTPFIAPNQTSSYGQYTIKVESASVRDKLREHLNNNNIPTAVYYPLTLPMQEALCNKYGTQATSSLISAEAATQTCLSLPIYAGIPHTDILSVCNSISDFFKNNK